MRAWELFENEINVKVKDASDTFGRDGAEQVFYTDTATKSRIIIARNHRPDGYASVVELLVPEEFRGTGIGKKLLDRAMQDNPKIMGQVSSKAAAVNAYKAGRRPYEQPDASLDDVFKSIDQDSSVNLMTNESAAHYNDYFDANALKDPSKTKYGSNEKLITMTPDEFLSMAEHIPAGASTDKAEKVKGLIDSGTKFDSVPHIGFTHDGNGVATAVGHEGRHRVMALKSLGINEIPVLLTSIGGGGGKIRWDQQSEKTRDTIEGVWPTVLKGESGGSINFPIPDMRQANESLTVLSPHDKLTNNRYS